MNFISKSPILNIIGNLLGKPNLKNPEANSIYHATPCIDLPISGERPSYLPAFQFKVLSIFFILHIPPTSYVFDSPFKLSGIQTVLTSLATFVTLVWATIMVFLWLIVITFYSFLSFIPWYLYLHPKAKVSFQYPVLAAKFW